MKDFDFLDFLDEHLIAVEARLRDHPGGHNQELLVALQHLLDAGGKRIRPILSLLMGIVLGGKPTNLVTLGAAVELLHTATLVHDDLIDEALLRRGNPTLNANWSPAATVLTGDYIFSRAASMAAELDSPAVMKIFADTLSTIVSGEVTQLFDRQKLSSEEDYYHRIYEKTGSMFVLATKAAAVLSGSEAKLVENAAEYGKKLGMAFQIVDDVLDITGDQAVVGKPVGSDLRQGIITLPVIYFLDDNPGDPRVRSVIENGLPEEEMLDLIQDIRDGGAIQRAHQTSDRFIDQAVSAVGYLPESREREALKQIAHYVGSRKI